MTQPILVTGAAGFLGRNVVAHLLSQGADVHAIYNSAPTDEDTRGLTFWRSGGITATTLKALPGSYKAIYHCAGSGSVAQSLHHPEQDFQSNVLTTQAILEYARTEGGAIVVLPSSAGVYGVAETLPIRITSPCKPASPYGINKLMSEMLAQQYGTYFDVPVAIVRLFSVYGPHLRKQLLWDACSKLTQGDATFFGTGAETRDWIHVKDATTLLLKAEEAASPAVPIMNGGCGQAIPIRNIITGLAQRLHVVKSLSFNGVTRSGDPKHYAADITDALALGWRPQVVLDAGLDEYVAWFMETSASTKPSAGE